MGALDVVDLRVVSPCEHGVEHPIKELMLGMSFSVRECRDSKGVPRNHRVTEDKYPTAVRRR